MRKLLLLACAALVVAVPVAIVDAAPKKPKSVRALTAKLSGAAERPDPGDPDGKGTAVLRLNANRGRVCFNISMKNINGSTLAHIHEAPAGSPGPPIVTLFDTASTARHPHGCVTGVDAALIREILANPRDYYVNVHNGDFPGGAIRGQLRKKPRPS